MIFICGEAFARHLSRSGLLILTAIAACLGTASAVAAPAVKNTASVSAAARESHLSGSDDGSRVGKRARATTHATGKSKQKSSVVRRCATASKTTVNLAVVPDYQIALKLFDKEQFAAALSKFEELEHNGFCCDLLHYYIAACYHRLNQVQQARAHYRLVAKNTDDALLRRYSNSGCRLLACYEEHRLYEGQGAIVAPVVCHAAPVKQEEEQFIDFG